MKIHKKIQINISTKKITLLAIILLATTTFSSSIGLAMNQQNPTNDSSTTSLTYSLLFEEPKIQTIALYNQDFSKIYLPGALLTGQKCGEPMIPAKPVTILLPQGTELEQISVTYDESIILDTSSKSNLIDTPIAPYQGQIPIGSTPPEEITFNQLAYKEKTSIPGKLFDHVSIGYCRGYTLLTTTLYPTNYNPSQGIISYYPTMNIDIDVKETGKINKLYRGLKDDNTWVQSLVMNPEIISTYQLSSKDTFYPGGICNPLDNNGQGYDYVIITTEALYEFTETYSWDDLILKKESEGLSATKVKVEDIIITENYWNTSNTLFNDSAAIIREFCKDAYQDWNTQYILIGGDDNGPNMIERREMDSDAESNVETDIYWTHLDNSFNEDGDNDWGEENDEGFDYYSEMYSGSIPCDEGTDISNWLTKSFYYTESYEIDYLENAAFFGGDTGWDAQGDTVIEFSAILGTDDWIGPNPEGDGPYPTWLGFQWGFETWNEHYPQNAYNLSVKWTGEPPNPGWQGGSTSSAVTGLKNAINNDHCTLISAVAHANSGMSMDVYASSWESDYHNTKPFFLTDQGCHCGDMDASDDGVLHSMLFHDDTELAFACIYNTGYGWGNYDGTNASSAVQMKSFWDYMFDISNNSQSTNNWQLGKAQEWARDLMAPAINWNPDGDDGAFRNTIQSCLLFGDPAQKLRIPFIPDHDIMVTNLDIPSIVAHGETQTVSATILNIGNNTETDIIVDFKVNGSVIDTTLIASLNNMDSTSVSFPWNPTIGTYLLSIESQPIPNEYDLFNNHVNKTITVIAAPAIAVSPTTFSFLVPTDASDTDVFTIENLASAEAALEYNITCIPTETWLSVIPDSGIIPIDDTHDITVFINTTSLDQGDYQGNIVISSNDLDDSEVIVSVDLTVVYGNDMTAVSVNSPVGVVPAGLYSVNATVQNLGSYNQTGVLVNCSIYEGGIGGTIIDEDFSSDPVDWTITHVDGTAWTWDSVDERMENSYGYPNAGYLDSPVLDCSGKNGITLSFWHYWKADYSSGDQDGYVYGSIDGGSTFPYVIDEFHHNDPGEEDAVKYYDISSWADGQALVMVRFDVWNDNDWYWRIDDFNVSAEITGDLVYSSEQLIDAAQYESQFIEFSPAWNAILGVYGVQITTLLAGDENSGNDVTADVVSVEGPGLAFTPGSYDAGTMGVNQSDSTSFDVWNDGVGLLTYALSESCDWVEIDPVSGDSTGEHDTITVDIDTTGLALGSHHCDILIGSDGGSGVFGVDVYVVSSSTELLDVDQPLYERGFPVRHALDGDWAAAQDFTPTLGMISSVDLYLRMFGTPEFDLTVELRSGSPDGVLLDAVVFPAGEVPSSWDWLHVDFADVVVSLGVDYFIVVPPAPGGVTTSFGYEWAYEIGDVYDGGSFWFTRDGGGLWRDLPDTYEFTFKTYGIS